MTRLLSDIGAVLGIRYALYIALLTITGLMEAVSLAALVPLLQAVGIGSDATVGSGRIGALVIGVLEAAGVAPTPIAVCGVVVAALAASTLMFMAQAYFGAHLQTAYVYAWQQRLATSMFRARWAYFQRRRHGDLVNALITEPSRLGAGFYQMGLLITGCIHALLFLAVAAVLSGAATAVVIAGGALLFLVTRPLVRRSYVFGLAIADANATLQSLAGELVAGAKLVKATATEREATRLITASADRLRRNMLANAFDIQVIKATFDFGAAATGVAILVTSQSLLRSDPAVTLVVLAIFVRLMPKLTSIQHGLQALAFITPAIETMQAIASDADGDAEQGSASVPLPDALRHGPLQVELRNVGVRYGEADALSDVTLTVNAGECVALVGGSGAGKSTLVDAALGLAPLVGGEVRFDGAPLQDLPIAALRRRIGYVGQETVLYHGTIQENVAWARSGSTRAEFDTAIRLAGAAPFVAKLPAGADTVIGDRGLSLSGGERQRLGLARAVLGAPGLLVLDEATNALDAETERAVIDAVGALKGRTTVIMIAHRLLSLRIADRICVLEAGRIVEQGSWSELMDRCGRFHELWTLQHSGERI